MKNIRSRFPAFHYGWLIVGSAVGTSFASVAFFNPVLGAFTQSLEFEFGWSRAAIASAISVGSLLGGIAAPWSGAIIDRWGSRWVIAVCGTGMAIACISLSTIDSLWQLILFYGIGRALSMGGMQASSYITVSNWYIKKRALVASIVGVGQRLGMATLPLAVALTIQFTDSWRNAWVILSVLLLMAFLPALLFMRRRPEDIGLLPDDEVQLPQDNSTNQLPTTVLELDRTSSFTLREALHLKAYWLVGIALSITMMTSGSINFHQIPYLIEHGLRPGEAALVITVWSIMGAAGSLLGGIIAQRITMRRTMIATLILMALTIPLLARATTLRDGMLYALTNGLAFGAHVTFMQVIHADYFGRFHVGKIRGSFQPIQLGMNALGPPVIGIWYDRLGSYDGVFIVFVSMFLIATTCYIFAPYPKKSLTLPKQLAS